MLSVGACLVSNPGCFKLLIDGKIQLIPIANNQTGVSTYTGGGLIPALIDEAAGIPSTIYVLSDTRNGYTIGLPCSVEKTIKEVVEAAYRQMVEDGIFEGE